MSWHPSILSIILLSVCLFLATLTVESITANPSWLVNYPPTFHNISHNASKLIDVRNHKGIEIFERFIETNIWKIDHYTDGEIVDVLEHFFWGQRNGLSLELGSLDGSPKTRSMTYDLEQSFGWHRILVDGNPIYREPLRENSPNAFGAIAPICQTESTMHFAKAEYVGGIIEFMSPSFMLQFHKRIYNAGVPPGNLSSIDWSKHANVISVDCIPLSHVLHKAKVKHINFFILDAEGGELEILKSIHWNHTIFDVLCIETKASARPLNYAADIAAFLAARGYQNYTDQVGRNTWYTRKGFIPYKRPGLDPQCYNGCQKSLNAISNFVNRTSIPFHRCNMTYEDDEWV